LKFRYRQVKFRLTECFAWHDISIDLLKMKKLLTLLLILSAIFLNSCAVVGGIFKAGVWVGILIVVFFIGIIIWLVTRSGKS
jgi:TM2 domain-containing membrane protein YozV